MFELFQFSFFLVKIVNHCEGCIIYQGTEHQRQENVVHRYFIVVFYEIVAKFRRIFNALKTVHR